MPHRIKVVVVAEVMDVTVEVVELEVPPPRYDAAVPSQGRQSLSEVAVAAIAT